MRHQYIQAAFLLILIVIQFQPVYSQTTNENETKIGITGLVQGSQFDILIPILLNGQVSIAPGLGLQSVQDAGTDIRFSITAKYLFLDEKYAPYIGGRLGVLNYSSDYSSFTDLLFGLACGGEYFLDDHFSFGVEGQLNITKSDEKSTRFGNPGKTTLNTATAIYATFYF